jgi:aspartate aminotransferase
MVGEFKRRRDLMVGRLNEMGWECKLPEGAFYTFPYVKDSQEFVSKALANEVVTVPGEAFGKAGSEHVRMSYAVSYSEIESAMDRLEKINI